MRDSTRRDSTRFFLLGSILAPPGSRRVRTLRSPCVLSSLTTYDQTRAPKRQQRSNIKASEGAWTKTRDLGDAWRENEKLTTFRSRKLCRNHLIERTTKDDDFASVAYDVATC